MSNEVSSVFERLVVVETEMRLHAAECVSYRLETREKLTEISKALTTLVQQSNVAAGRAEVNRAIFSKIPDAFWSAAIAGIMALGGSGLTILVLRLTQH